MIATDTPDIVGRLRTAHAICANDDYSKPMTRERSRQVEIREALTAGAARIEADAAEITRLRTALAAAEAREAAKDEALTACRSLSGLDNILCEASAIVMSRMADIYQHSSAALTTDRTALSALRDEVIEEMATWIEPQRADVPAHGWEFAAALRALKENRNG